MVSVTYSNVRHRLVWLLVLSLVLGVTFWLAKPAQAEKPGPRVALVDPGPVAVTEGQVSPLTLHLRADYLEGVMEIRVRAEKSLEIVSSPQQFRFELAADRHYSLPLEIYPPIAGRFYLILQIHLRAPGVETQTRTLGLVVRAGPSGKSSSIEALKTEPGNPVHSLPAQERILTPGRGKPARDFNSSD